MIPETPMGAMAAAARCRPNRLPETLRVAVEHAVALHRPAWGIAYGEVDTGAEVASIGPLAGGSEAWDAQDRIGIMALPGGRVELLDFRRHWTPTFCETPVEAVAEVTRMLASRGRTRRPRTAQ